MLSIYRENPGIFNLKGFSLKDFQTPIVLIKQGADFSSDVLKHRPRFLPDNVVNHLPIEGIQQLGRVSL